MSATCCPPDPTAPHIVRFCEMVVPGVRPQLMPIQPSDGSRPLECFSNVRRLVETHGGNIQFGWSIWKWPCVYVEAEHHAVYAPAEETPWIDVTPAVDGDVERVFLPDDTAIYDFENEGARRENHRMPLVNDPLVDQLFSLALGQNQIRNSIPRGGLADVPAYIVMELDRIAKAKELVAYKLGMKYTRRNQRCFCGSGEKFKRCHGARS